MTDLERVREAIRFAEEYGYNNWMGAQDELNTHLKENAALRRVVEHEQKMRHDMAAELTELREAAWDYFVNPDLSWSQKAEDRLRQLIEEKE